MCVSQIEFKENQEFMPCKFCDSTKATLVRISRNINGGAT
jgi:hypothetical protein